MSGDAGEARLSRAAFCRRLGPAAQAAWGLLVALRERYGNPVTVGIDGIAAKTRHSPSAVTHALRRLREAGLVEDAGRAWVEDRQGRPTLVHLRRVRGTPCGREEVLLPGDAWARLTALGTHGGKRKGAGRKPRGAAKVTRQLDSPQGVEVTGHLDSAGEIKVASRPGNQDGLLIDLDLDQEGSSLLRKELARGARRPEVGVENLPAGASLAEKVRLLSAGAPTQRVPSWGQGGLPHHPPGEELHYRVPPPPRVPLGLEREAQLAFVARWYRAAVASRLGACHPVQLRGPTRKYFEDALDVFLEKEIRPGAWVAWALDRVLVKLPANARQRFHPRVAQLLSPKLLTECRWMFREAAADYCTAQVRLSPAGEGVLLRMRALLEDAQACGGQGVPALVARHFPEGFEAARKEARENTQRLGQGVREEVQGGEWVWQLPKALRRKAA